MQGSDYYSKNTTLSDSLASELPLRRGTRAVCSNEHRGEGGVERASEEIPQLQFLDFRQTQQLVITKNTTDN